MPKKKKSENETAEEKAEEKIEADIVKDIEKDGVPESIAKKEENIAERVEKELEKKAESQASASLVKAAEAESLSTENIKEDSEQVQVSSNDNIERKKKEILEKAKKLAEKLEKPTTEELKEKIKIKKRTDMLIPLEEYVKSGIYLGTRVITPDMRPFVYRRRADGLAIFNTDLIDEKLKEAIEYFSKFDAKDIILVCKRQAGWKAAEMFSRLTGIRTFTKKYPAGILTNTALPDFFENELSIITDSWLDKNALHDTVNARKKVLMLCDTNNFARNADQIIIGNNKSSKSLGVIFYLLTRGYCKAKGLEVDVPDLDFWTVEEEPQIEERTRRIDTRFGV
ncbi:MAG: hypothetical protein NTU63_00480 [Candidatus Pacearchaeota archaeon]|nr:hypothetical protein [Candidatus Pacearchaeota archaeon]